MEGYRRYAIYAAPEGPLGDWAARWLGWDAVAGAEVDHPPVPGLMQPVEMLTATPRKYGFHGTIKPPFRMAEGASVADLHAAAWALCEAGAPVRLAGLRLARLGGFLALVPDGDATALAVLAQRMVEGLDGFRAPPDASEIARRKPEGLTPRQRALMDRWGYPFVAEEFQFHLTLTGELPPEVAASTEAALALELPPLIPAPFVLDSLCLFGEGADGRFRLLHRYALSG